MIILKNRNNQLLQDKKNKINQKLIRRNQKNE